MDFIDEVRTRSSRFAQRTEHFNDQESTEESTKTSLVLPFIQMLGYDIFNPAEVLPEFTADIGTKKGEKVDFALMQDGHPIILIECKKLGTTLSSDTVSQLLRYFGVTESHVGILTDGIFYRFFSDLDQSNVMDPRPFFEFNMLDFTEIQVKELKRFTKDEFDKSSIIGAARELRYTAEIKGLLARELMKPSDDFVRYVIRQVYEGRVSVASRNMFKELTFSAFNQFISDKIQDRLASALKQEGDAAQEQRPDKISEKETPEFAPAELAALNTVKAILGGIVNASHLGLRQAKRYCSVVLHRSPEKKDYGTVLFHLYARRPESVKVKGPGVTPIALDTIEDLFAHTDHLRKFVQENEAIAAPASDHATPPVEIITQSTPS